MGFEAAQLYARALFLLGHGYPLFCPEPNEALHPEYIENGIRFGDVGLITPDGSFDFLFNICLPADHVINQSCGTPDNFTPVKWNGQIRRNSNYFQPGKPVCSRCAKCREISAEAMATIPGSPVGVGASIEISFDKESGAALMLPTGAKRENMLDLKAFREYAQANAVSWYYFVNNTLGRDAENGSIYLVTGFDKSDAWENAVFDSSQSSRSCSLLFESVGIASGRMKLSQSSIYQSSVTSRASAADAQYNQALFIRGFRISLRSGLSVRILGEVKVASTDRSPMKDIFSPAPRFGQSGYSFSTSWGRSSTSSRSGSPSTDAASSNDGPESSDGSTTTSGSDWDCHSPGGSSCSDTTSINEDDFPPSQPYHPLISINNDILQNNPEIDVVVTHDNDWISLLTATDTAMPDDQILMRRFRQRYYVLESDGFAVLKSHMEGSNQGTSTRQNSQVPTTSIPTSGLASLVHTEDASMLSLHTPSLKLPSPSSPRLDGLFDFVFQDPCRPLTPYSVHSKLSFEDGDNTNFGFFAGGIATYDIPAGNSLLMFNDTDYLSSYDPTQSSSMNIHQSYGDYGSPASSNGGGDSGNEVPNDPRSRASSVSPNHHHHLSPSPYIPSQHLSPSPRMSVAQSFGEMSFQSLNGLTESLPVVDNHSPRNSQFPQHQPQPNSRSISPNHLGTHQKPQSSPRLLMPEEEGFPNQPPAINAPDGDAENGGSGPSLRIVPATRISGLTKPILFRNGSPLAPGSHSWDNQPQRHHSFSPTQPQSVDRQSPPSHQATSSSKQPGSSFRSGQTFLFPQGNPRHTRSKSDGALEPPTWDTTAFLSLLDMPAIVDDAPAASGVSMNDVNPSSPPSRRPSGLGNRFYLTFPSATNTGENGFLSPENSALRRSRSDGAGPARGHVRQSRSEDYRFGLPVPGINVSDGDHATANNSNMLYPPNQDDFLRQQQQLRNQQFLSPDMRQGYSYPGPGSNNQLNLLGSQLPNLGAGMGLDHMFNTSIRRPASVGHIRRPSSCRSSPSRSHNVNPRGGTQHGLLIPDTQLSRSRSMNTSFPEVRRRPKIAYFSSPGTSGVGSGDAQKVMGQSCGGNPYLDLWNPLPNTDNRISQRSSSANSSMSTWHDICDTYSSTNASANCKDTGPVPSPDTSRCLSHTFSPPKGELSARSWFQDPSQNPLSFRSPSYQDSEHNLASSACTVPEALFDSDDEGCSWSKSSDCQIEVGSKAVQEASVQRRKNEATFFCERPGCSSFMTEQALLREFWFLHSTLFSELISPTPEHKDAHHGEEPSSCMNAPECQIRLGTQHAANSRSPTT
ncbi:hypothetical protein VNI00_014256 [Paramarasmius palmivorus]|uniref:C2H2-type domain-containing protein n=1 Tax=Paramarasmius palmivorus TaxID=297713 RepID=A0AAW0BVI1_9AGAR